VYVAAAIWLVVHADLHALTFSVSDVLTAIVPPEVIEGSACVGSAPVVV